MSTNLAIRYGELITDTAIHRANPIPPGIYDGMVPTVAPAGGGAFTATLGPNPATGVSVWRTRPQTAFHGSVTVYEDGNLNFPIAAPSPQPRIDLLVASHKWVQGPIDSGTGKPTGELLPEMLPKYFTIQGTPGATPVAPLVNDPCDIDGRRPMVLASIRVDPGGATTIRRWAPSDMRPEAFLKSGGGLALDPTQLPWGPSLLPTLTNLDALRAIPLASRVDQQPALVIGVGLYQFRATETAQDNGGDVIAPQDGSGRWVRTLGGSTGGGGSTASDLFNFNTFS